MIEPQPLEERYGKTRQRGFDRRFAWVVAGLLIIGGLAVVLFGGWQQGSRVAFQDIGRDIVSDHQVDVRFEVSAPPHTPVVCAVQALSESKATVGWKIVEIPVSAERDHRVSTSVMTTFEATTGSVRECWILTSS
ncbi:MAG: DUF4307 domain-containing protein [Leucobacter sp.]